MRERNINSRVRLGFLGRIEGRVGVVLFYWADPTDNQSFFKRGQHETYTMVIFCISCSTKNWEEGIKKLSIQDRRRDERGICKREKEPRRRGQIGCNCCRGSILAARFLEGVQLFR